MGDQISKSAIRRAGEVLRTMNEGPQYQDALTLLNSWRASHVRPLHSLMQGLRKIAAEFEPIIVAQRLKRTPTIIDKLSREPKMQLDRMWDIAGGRIVLPTVAKAREFSDKLERSRIRSKIVDRRDYVANPDQRDGYRSIHKVYRFRGLGPTLDYDGRRVEVQIRSKIQHEWATAVETVGTILRQSLKNDQGDIRWRNYFRYLGSALASMEGERLDPNILLAESDLFVHVANETRDLGVEKKLRTFETVLQETRAIPRKAYAILHLTDSEPLAEYSRKLSVETFPQKRIDEAVARYNQLEKDADVGEDVVLVSTDRIHDLAKAYPNYFSDSQDFLKRLASVKNRAYKLQKRALILGSKQLETVGGAQLPMPFAPALQRLPDEAPRMPPIIDTDKVPGGRYGVRILWALELASRAGYAHITPGNISDILLKFGNIEVFSTNVARYFRQARSNPSQNGLWHAEEGPNGNRYSISEAGRQLFHDVFQRDPNGLAKAADSATSESSRQ